MLPPWKKYSYGWLSASWQAKTSQYRESFKIFYLSLDELGKKEFVRQYPESPWWQGYYTYLEMKEGDEGFKSKTRILMRDLKESQAEYAKKQYEEALRMVEEGEYFKAKDVVDEILRNYGGMAEVFELSDLIESKFKS